MVRNTASKPLRYHQAHVTFLPYMLKAVHIPFSGHPDKICDQIVEGVVDEYLKRDPQSRINIQALGSHGMLMLGGSVDSRADFDISSIIRRIYADIGYKDDIEPFVNIEKWTEERAKTLVNGGAQGTVIVHGYATKETREYLPKALVYAQEIAGRYEELRRHEAISHFLRPDGSVQLCMNGKEMTSITLGAQHGEEIEHKDMQTYLVDKIVNPVIGSQEGVKLLINSTGTFHQGGFAAGSGASGQKEMIASYGGLLPHGGSHMTGKDPHNPAKCGAVMARYIAKTLVKEGRVGNVLVTLVYSVGQKEPIHIQVRGGKGEDLADEVKKRFDLKPEAIVEQFALRAPIWRQVTVAGLTASADAPWEQVG
jgi:S-adenosylmethionine synthetase